MPPLVFGLVTALALAYLVLGLLIGTSSTTHLITGTLVNWGLLCLGALVAVRLARLRRRR